MISTMRTKVETIQQIDNVTDGVNLRAEAKRFTHRRCKVLTYCQFIKGGGCLPVNVGTDVPRVQNLGRAKFLQKNLIPGQKVSL